MYQTNPQQPPKSLLPTMYDLPSEGPEEPGLSDQFHIYQPRLLDETFRPANYPAEEILTATDLNLYYDFRHTQWYKRPDWFAVVGVPRLYNDEDLRLSYVIWQEEVSPLIVIELLSSGTEKEDLGETESGINQPPTKWEVYEQILQIPYYVTYSRYTQQMQAFTLTQKGCQRLLLNHNSLWIKEIQMSLGLWEGTYEQIPGKWLRWQDENGDWILTPAEAERQRANMERQRADMEQQRADMEQQRAERLEARLRELGIDPNQINE